LKIALVAVGVLFLFGVIAIGSMYHAARRYVKLAEENAKKPKHMALNRGRIEGARNSKSPYFAFTLERENGKIAFIAFRIVNGDMATVEFSEPPGLGDASHCGYGRFQAVCGSNQPRPNSRSFPGERGKIQRNRVIQDDSFTTAVRLSKGQTK
jgi:hypothetical protein